MTGETTSIHGHITAHTGASHHGDTDGMTHGTTDGMTRGTIAGAIHGTTEDTGEDGTIRGTIGDSGDGMTLGTMEVIGAWDIHGILTTQDGTEGSVLTGDTDTVPA